MKPQTWKLQLSAVGVVLLITSVALQAQYLISANPADRGDPRASFSNAALVATQDRLLSVGSKALFYGVVGSGLDLTHSYFTFTNSRRTFAGIDGFGVGVQGQVLHTPMFNAVSVNAMLARQWSEKFALGMNLGFANRGFDVGSFILDALDDPLTQHPSKWLFPDIGVGLMVIPTRNLTFGLGFNHLTQPSYAISDTVKDAYLPRSLSAGIAFGLGNSYNSFRTLLSVSYEERKTLPLFAVEGYRENLGSLMAGLGRESAFFDAKLRLMEGIALNLRYSYPLNELGEASGGSPELGLIFNLDKNLSLYAMEWTKPPVPLAPVISPSYAFQVESAYDTLFITEKYIKRLIADSLKQYLLNVPKSVFFAAEEDSVLPRLPEEIFLTEEELAQRPKIGASKLLQILNEKEKTEGKARVPRDSSLIVEQMKRTHSARYLSALRELMARLQSYPGMQSNFVTPQDRDRTHLILRYLSLYTPLTDTIKVSVEDTVAATVNRRNIVGTNTVIPDTAFRLSLQVHAPNGNGRFKLMNAPVDTFHFDINEEETRRWGPVSGTLILKDAEGRIVYLDSAIVQTGKDKKRPQIWRRKSWNWKLATGEYPKEGNYYYHLVWEAKDKKLYRSPERMLRIERSRIESKLRVSRKMPEPTGDTPETRSRLKALIHMN